MSDTIARRASTCVSVIMLSFVVVGAQPPPQSPAIAPEITAFATQLLAAPADEREALLNATVRSLTEIVKALHTEGDRRYNEGQYASAADAFRIGVEVAEKAGDQRATGSLWRAIGYSVREIDRLDDAEQAFTRALDAFTLSADEGLVAAVTKSFGILRRRQGRYDEARSLYLSALAVFRRLGDEGEVASTLSSLAVLEGTVGDFPTALTYHLEGVETMRRINYADLAIAISNLGALYKELGDGVNAELQYREALQLARAAKDRPQEALVLSNLGNIQYVHGDPEEGFRTLQESLAIYEALKVRGRAATVLNLLGALRLAQGNLEQAEGYFLRGLTIRESLKDSSASAYSLHNVASVYREQGRLEEALVAANRALALRETIGEKSTIAATLRRIGTILTDQGRLDHAAAALGRSRDIAEAIGDRLAMSRTLEALAILAQRRGRDREVVELSRSAVTLAQNLNLPERLWRALALEGSASARLGDRAAAQLLLNAAIDSIEDLRSQGPDGEQDRQMLFQGRVAPYYQLAKVHFQMQDWRASLIVAERAKARVLRDVLATGRADVTSSMTETEKSDEEKLRLRLASANVQTATESQRRQPNAARLSGLKRSQRDARVALDTFRTNLYSRHAGLKTRRAEDTLLDPAKLTAALPSRTAAVEFVVGDESTLAFVVKSRNSKDDVDVFAYEVPITRASVNARVEKFRSSIGDRSLGFAGEARALHDLLLGPAAPRLGALDTLFIVPDDALWTLPFQALQPSAGRYLLEAAPIAYVSSLTVLSATAQDGLAGAPRNSLIVAGPDGQAQPAPPGQQRLVSALRTIYGPTSELLSGAAADERAVTAALPRYSVIHFSGHGVLDGPNPMDSYLRLASDSSGREDGVLDARELMRLNLQADVMVLAGCETAMGRIGAGEGIVGLTWSAFIAGAATTVVSQWNVDAERTTDLMIEFHRQRSAGRLQYLSTARALQRAAISLLRSPATDHPFYWAGFTVVGRP